MACSSSIVLRLPGSPVTIRGCPSVISTTNGNAPKWTAVPEAEGPAEKCGCPPPNPPWEYSRRPGPREGPGQDRAPSQRRRATLRASQHAHATGPGLALDDGQALVLDQTSEGVRVVEADDAGHEVIARCAQPPVQ